MYLLVLMVFLFLFFFLVLLRFFFFFCLLLMSLHFSFIHVFLIFFVGDIHLLKAKSNCTTELYFNVFPLSQQFDTTTLTSINYLFLKMFLYNRLFSTYTIYMKKKTATDYILSYQWCHFSFAKGFFFSARKNEKSLIKKKEKHTEKISRLLFGIFLAVLCM